MPASTGEHARLTAEQRDMVEANLGLASKVAWKHTKRRQDYADILGDARLGLCVAALTFDESKSRFSTYGTIGARNHVTRQVARQCAVKRGAVETVEHHCPRDLAQMVAADDRDLDDEPSGEAQRRYDLLRWAMGKLDDRRRDIVESRLCGETLRHIGARLGICYERVRVLEHGAHKQPRRLLEGKIDA
jgi:RNA polymerase sigma factor (sigma-70 family)